MGVNKVVCGTVAVMDISDSTVTEDTLSEGSIAYGANGERITGKMKAGVELPALTNPGSASDLAQGKQLIGADGSVVNGNVEESTLLQISNAEAEEDDGFISLYAPVDNDVIIRKGGTSRLYISLSKFGNATPADVRQGVTFTSESGLMRTGEALLPGGGSVYPDGAFAPVTNFTDGKQYALVTVIDGVRRYINTTAYNNYTMNATQITIGEDAGDYVIFAETPALFTAVASGDGFLLQNGSNYLYGTSSNGTALRFGTTQMVWTVDTSANGGFSDGKYYAKEDPNAVWLMNGDGGYAWSIKYETNGGFGYDREGRDSTWSTGFTPLVLYEYVAGEGELNPIVDTSDANVTADKMLAGYSDYANGQKVEGSIQLQSKTATANGTVTPDTGKYLSSVIVNVPSSGTSLPEGAIVVQMVMDSQASQQIGSGYSLSVTYGDNVEIDDSIALAFSGTTETLSNISTTTDFSVLLGKYVRTGSSYGSATGTFYYIPDDATFTVGGQTMSNTLTCDKAQKVSMQKVSV